MAATRYRRQNDITVTPCN